MICLLAGPLLFLCAAFSLPVSVFPSLAARAALGMVAWMSFWWITAPVDLAVTAFLPIAVNALLPMAEMSAVIANYASETILLLLGASILVASWEITGLDRRIARTFLMLIGNGMRQQVAFWFLLSAALSSTAVRKTTGTRSPPSGSFRRSAIVS